MLIKKSILRSLGDQSWGFQVSCEATASEYWELSEQDGPFFAVKCLRLTLGFVPIEASIVTHMSDWSMRKSQLQSLETLHPWSLNWTLLLAIFFFFFKWHRNRNEATLSHSGFLQHMHCPFHYSWCVFTDSALNHEEYSCLSFPERALWNERTCTWGAHNKKKACSHLVLEKITCRRLCGSHWRWKKFIWLINSWSISSVKLYATPEFPVLSRNQAARLPLR